MLLVLSNNFWLIALTTNTCAFIWTNPRSEVSMSDCYTEERQTNGSATGHLLRSPFWYLLSDFSFFSESDLWTCSEARIALYSYFLLLIVLFFFHFFVCFWWWKTSRNYWNTKTLDANLWYGPHFDKLWIRSISFSFFFPDLLLDCVSMCMSVCMCACISECVWREEEKRKERDC